MEFFPKSRWSELSGHGHPSHRGQGNLVGILNLYDDLITTLEELLDDIKSSESGKSCNALPHNYKLPLLYMLRSAYLDVAQARGGDLDWSNTAHTCIEMAEYFKDPEQRAHFYREAVRMFDHVHLEDHTCFLSQFFAK